MRSAFRLAAERHTNVPTLCRTVTLAEFATWAAYRNEDLERQAEAARVREARAAAARGRRIP